MKLRCVAGCCSMLRCVAVCCSVLHFRICHITRVYGWPDSAVFVCMHVCMCVFEYMMSHTNMHTYVCVYIQLCFICDVTHS